MEKRWACTLLAVAMLAVMLAGCGQTASASDPQAGSQEETQTQVKEITYAHLGDWAIPYLTEAAQDFEAETGIKVNIQPWTFQDGYEKYVTSIEADSKPDCGMGFSDWAAEFYERGAIYPVDDIISDSYRADIYEGALNACMYKGMLLGVPFATSARVPVYRSDLFEEAGLEPPTTVDNLVAACEALYDSPNMYGYGFCSARNKNTTEFFLELFWALGGEVLNEDETAAAFNSEAGIETMETLKRLAVTSPEGYQTSDIYLGENAFTAGNLAVMFDGNWIRTDLEKNHPDKTATVLPYIEGPDGDKGNLFIVDMLYVFSDDPAVREACMQWIEFYKSNEKYLGQAYIDYGFAADLKSQSSWKFMESDDAATMAEAAECGNARPITAAWAQIDDAIAVAVGKVCAGEATPEEALAEAEETANAALAAVG